MQQTLVTCLSAVQSPAICIDMNITAALKNGYGMVYNSNVDYQL